PAVIGRSLTGGLACLAGRIGIWIHPMRRRVRALAPALAGRNEIRLVGIGWEYWCGECSERHKTEHACCTEKRSDHVMHGISPWCRAFCADGPLNAPTASSRGRPKSGNLPQVTGASQPTADERRTKWDSNTVIAYCANCSPQIFEQADADASEYSGVRNRP